MGREFELKYRANPEKITSILEKYKDFTPISMETAYYDALDGSLRRRRWTLRRRLENGRPVCTLKTPLPDGSRGEWEVEAEAIEDAIPQLCDLSGSQELQVLTACGLARTCGARFTRLAKEILFEGALLELALDQGVLLGGSQTLPLDEVEVELKSGPEEAAIAFAAALAGEFDLTEEPKSKVQRALALAKPI